MRKKWLLLLLAASAIGGAISFTMTYAQQAPPPGGAPGAGARPRMGGFSEPEPIDFGDTTGWTSIFDGKTLNGWDGDPKYWRVEDGSIVSESSCEKPTGTIYIVWQGGELADFEIKFEMRGEGALINSGLQYRGSIMKPGEGPPQRAGGRPPQSPNCPSGQPRGTPPDKASQAKWEMVGPQLDFDGRNRYSGQFYDQATGRGIIAWRGQVVRTEEGKKPRLLATLGNRDELGGYIKLDDWNQLHLIARGAEMTHIINGHTMAILIDDDHSKFRKSGLIGFEIESVGKIMIRNIWIKKL